MSLSGDRSFVVADVPGLIEGAHEGHGLGYQFLKHIERTKVLVHLVDISSETGRDPVDDFEIIRKELKSYSADVFAKPQITVANKLDALDDPDRLRRLEAHVKRKRLKLLTISGATGDGVPALLEAMWKAIAAGRIATAVVRACVRPSLRTRPHRPPGGDVAPRRRGSVRRRTSPTPATAPEPKSKGEGIDLLTPARSRRRGV